MDNKFELVEDFRSPRRANKITPQEDQDSLRSDWRPKYYDASEHPLKLMVIW